MVKNKPEGEKTKTMGQVFFELSKNETALRPLLSEIEIEWRSYKQADKPANEVLAKDPETAETPEASGVAE